MDKIVIPAPIELFKYMILGFVGRSFHKEFTELLRVEDLISATNPFCGKRLLHLIRLRQCFLKMNQNRFLRYGSSKYI